MGLLHAHFTTFNLRGFSEPLVVPLRHRDKIINFFLFEFIVTKIMRCDNFTAHGSEEKDDYMLWGMEMCGGPVCLFWSWVLALALTRAQ